MPSTVPGFLTSLCRHVGSSLYLLWVTAQVRTTHSFTFWLIMSDESTRLRFSWKYAPFGFGAHTGNNCRRKQIPKGILLLLSNHRGFLQCTAKSILGACLLLLIFLVGPNSNCLVMSANPKRRRWDWKFPTLSFSWHNQILMTHIHIILKTRNPISFLHVHCYSENVWTLTENCMGIHKWANLLAHTWLCLTDPLDPLVTKLRTILHELILQNKAMQKINNV